MDPELLRQQANSIMKNVSAAVANGVGTIQASIGFGQPEALVWANIVNGN